MSTKQVHSSHSTILDRVWQRNLEHLKDADDPALLKLRAKVRLKLKDPQGARTDIVHSLKLQEDSDSLKLLAQIETTLKNTKGILAALDRLISLVPNDEEALRTRGEVKKILGDLRGARSDLDQATRIFTSGGTHEERPDLRKIVASETLLNMAWEKFKSNDLNEALAIYNHCIKRYPNDYQALSGRGTVRMRLDDLQGALNDFEKSLSLEPTQPEVRDNFELLRIDQILYPLSEAFVGARNSQPGSKQEHQFVTEFRVRYGELLQSFDNFKRKYSKFSEKFQDKCTDFAASYIVMQTGSPIEEVSTGLKEILGDLA